MEKNSVKTTSGGSTPLPPGNNPILTAQDRIYYDYWFLNDGILRIKILPPASYFAVMVGWLVAFEALIYLLPGLARYIALVDLGGLVTFIVLNWRRVRRTREQSLVSPKKVINDKKSSTLIPWSTVTSLEIRGSSLAIETSSAKYTAATGKTDLKSLTRFIRNKIGKKLVVR